MRGRGGGRRGGRGGGMDQYTRDMYTHSSQSSPQYHADHVYGIYIVHTYHGSRWKSSIASGRFGWMTKHNTCMQCGSGELRMGMGRDLRPGNARLQLLCESAILEGTL